MDGSKAGYHRLYSLPFLAVACLLGLASGIWHVYYGLDVIDLIMTLAGIGITLYGGGKYLSIKGQNTEVTSDNTKKGEDV